MVRSASAREWRISWKSKRDVKHRKSWRGAAWGWVFPSLDPHMQHIYNIWLLYAPAPNWKKYEQHPKALTKVKAALPALSHRWGGMCPCCPTVQGYWRSLNLASIEQPYTTLVTLAVSCMLSDLRWCKGKNRLSNTPLSFNAITGMTTCEYVDGPCRLKADSMGVHFCCRLICLSPFCLAW